MIPFTALSQIKTIATKTRTVEFKSNKHRDLKLTPDTSKIPPAKNTPDITKSIGGTGVDGGGGNLRDGDPLTRMALESYLSNSQPQLYPTSVQKILKYLFNSAYNSYTGVLFGYDPDNNPEAELKLRHLHRKLFERADRVTIYSVLKTAKIHLQDSPCLDPQTQKLNDASADVQSNTICLSWDRLSGKLFENNFESQILPLIAHEYFHLFGANEEEAKNLEDTLKKRVNFEKASQGIDDLQDHITHYTSSIPTALDDLRKTVLEGKAQNVCIKSFQLHSLLSKASDLFGTDDFFPLNALENSRFDTFDRRLLNLTKFCESIDMQELLKDGDDSAALEYAFKNGSHEMTVLDFETKIVEFYNSQNVVTRLSNDQLRFLPNEGTIAQVSTGDRQAVLSEVDKIISLVAWLAKETDIFTNDSRSTPEGK